MDASTLQELTAAGNSLTQMSAATGLSRTTLRYWLAKYGILTERAKDNRLGYYCKECGETRPAKFYGTKKRRCRKCANQKTVELFRGRKADAVEYKDGECQECGYKRCLAALEFHHRNPEEKDPDWTKLRRRRLDQIKGELDKCDLLCRNCHAEVHNELDEGL